MIDINRIQNYIGSYVRIKERDDNCEYYGILKSVNYNFGEELNSIISVDIHTISTDNYSRNISKSPNCKSPLKYEAKFSLRIIDYIIELKKEEMITEGVKNIEKYMINSSYNILLMTSESSSKLKSLLYHLTSKVLLYDKFPRIIDLRNLVQKKEGSKSSIYINSNSKRPEYYQFKIYQVGKIFTIKDGDIIYKRDIPAF